MPLAAHLAPTSEAKVLRTLMERARVSGGERAAGMTKVELAAQTRLAEGTVNRVLIDFAAVKPPLVVAAPTASGRRQSGHALNRDYTRALGLRYFDGMAHVIITDWAGQLLDEAPATRQNAGPEALRWMAEQAKALYAKHPPQAKGERGLAGTGFVLHQDDDQSWHGLDADITEHLSSAGLPRRPAIVVHPGYAGAFSEAWLGTSGPGQDFADAVFIRWSDEINVGVIFNRHVQRAEGLDRSLYGHIPTGDALKGGPCGFCGRRDCLVRHTGLRAMSEALGAGAGGLMKAMARDLRDSGRDGVVATAARRIAAPLGPTLTILGINNIIISCRRPGMKNGTAADQLSDDAFAALAGAMRGAMSVRPHHSADLPDPYLKFHRPQGRPVLGAAATAINGQLDAFAQPGLPLALSPS